MKRNKSTCSIKEQVDIVLFTSDKSRILASSFLSPQELHKTKIERENNVCFIISRGLLRNHYR